MGLIADPSQAPAGEPTIGLSRPGMGFAGVRSGGFGSLTPRNGVLSVCDPRDYFCNLPQSDVVMRFIGHLGSHLDSADPGGSAQKLATMFMAGLVSPATQAVNQILQLVNDPQLIPHLVQRGVAFAHALTQQLFWLAGPQVAGPAAELVNTATQAINLIHARKWAAIPAIITGIATKAAAVSTALGALHDKTSNLDTSGFTLVGNHLAEPGQFNAANLATAVLNAISVATGGVGTRSTGAFGPTFAQFTAANVAAAFKHFAEFISGNFHNNYETSPLDRNGHTGVQLVSRYFANQLGKLV